MPLGDADFESAFPNSRKVYVEQDGVRVPMREIAVGGGENPLRVYDTSGPRGHEIRSGLPALRAGWIQSRGDVEKHGRALRAQGGATPTQLHYARRGEITPEMTFIAVREGLLP